MLIKFEVKTELSVIRFFRLLLERLEQVNDAVRGECRLAKDAHDFDDRPANLEVVFDDSNEAVGDDGNVYLYTHCILGLSPESFDLKMLLDPFEKQLHLPPILVKQGDILGIEEEVVRVIDEAAVQLRSIIDDSPDSTRVLLLILLLSKADALVFEHVVRAIKDAFAIDNLICNFALLPDNEEGSEHMNLIETGEVKVASVKYIAGKSFICEPVHRVDIMDFGVGNPIEYRYLRGDVNLRVDFNARLCASEFCPSEHRHTEINGRGVDGIEPAMQFKLLCYTLGLGNGYHMESKLLEDTLVSEKIGFRKHLPVDRFISKAEMLRLLTMGGCDICKLPESSAAHQLAEHQNQHMVPMRKRPSFGPVVVLGEDSPEIPLREKLGYLCKNVLSNMHICSDFESGAKVRISKPGQGIGKLKRCA